MSSTEIEGSPPQCRRLAELESRYEKPRLDSIYSNALELRRISERSISIPSSEEENNISSKRASAGTRDFERNKNIQFPILFSSNIFHSEHQMPVKCEIDGNTMESLKYTLKRNDCHIGSRTEKVDYSKTRRKNNKISFEYSRARLNLSEGSGLECLYNRKSTHDSPSTDRRAKSLDIPIISKHKLPPKNAFSSKDDTFEIEEEADILEEKALYQGILNVEEELPDSVRSCEGSIPSAQVCYSHLIPDPILSSVSLDSEESDLLHRLKLIEKIALKGVKIKGRKISRMELKSGDHLILDIPKYNFDYSPLNSCNSSRKTSPGVSRASSLESTGMRKSKIRSKTSDAMELKPTIGSVIHPKKDKQNKVKGKPSYNYNDLERRLNHEKSKSLEKTEADIAKRKERQQKLYECAMKQTITMLSPVKDQLLQYPSHQNDNNVKTDGDKIIIETEFRNKTKNHVLIAKSPQKLDSSLLKFSRSFDESVCQKKLEKANRSFEDRKKSFEESEKSGIAEDFSPQSRRATTRNQFLEESGKHSKPPRMDKKSATSNTKSSHSNTPFQIESTNKTLARPLHIRSYISDRKVFANQFGFNEEIDMQAVICERRSLEILKRQSSRPEDITNDSDVSHIQSTEGSADSYVSLEENTFNFKPLLSHEDYREIIIPTTEYKEPLNESNYDTSNKCFELEVANGSTYHLTLARTKSDETTSWTTMECEEFIRSDTSENGLRAIETERDISTTDNPQALDKIGGLIFPKINTLINNSSASVENLIQQKNKQMRTFPKQSDKSKRSNSWTNGDGVATSSKFELFDWSLSQSGKEKSSVDDESSVSYSVARPFGISQDYGDFDNQKCLELKEKILIHDRKSILKNESVIDIKTNQLTSKKVSTPVLEKQSPIDFGLSNEVFQVDVEDNMLNNYPQDNNNFVNSSANISLVSKSLGKRIPENLSLAEKGPLGKSGNSGSDRSSQESKSSFDSRASLRIESKESFGTESSSCSLGLAQRRGDCLQREQQSTWKTFTIESSGSSSLGETVAHIDQESAEQMHSCIAIGELSDNDYKEHSFKEQEISNVKCQDEMIDLTTSLGYPGMTSALSGIGINSTDIVNYNAEFTVGRTLSRISERSTASEKSSVEDDVSKASTHSVSMPDESGCSYDHQPSLSSDSRSNTNLAYISDTERRTSAEMPDIPCDSATAERFPNKNKLRGSTVITGRFAVTQVDERTPEEFDRKTLLCLSNPESQDSEDWPLPEIPYDFIPVKPTELVLVVTDSDHPLPKALRWKGNMLFQSQDSKERNLNLLNGGDLPFSRNVEPHYIADANEKVPKKLVDIHKLNKEDTTYIPQYLKSKPHNLTSPPEEEKVLPYEDTSYFMLSPYKIKKQVDNTCFSRIQNDPPDCFDSALILPYCCSASRSFGDSYSLKEDIPKDTISIQPTHSLYTCCPVSAPDYISYDDSTPRYPDHNCAMWPGRKHIYGSRSSEKAAEEVFSILEEAYKDDQINVCRSFDKRPNTGFLRRCSHSSHSEEETSSFGTDLGETVRKGVQQKKCTHSSHSEDTSIGISISEWSTGTNTVHQYANLSGSDSLSAISYHSIGGKSEKPEQTVSIVNTKNTSYESSNGKGINFSCNKMFAMEDNSSDGQQKDIFLDSKTSNSKTRSDVTILTLPEKIQTATECSISNNQTFNGALQQIKQTKENKNHCDSCIGYMPLKNFRNLKKDPLILNENYVFPLTHENKKNTIIKKYSLCPTNVSPHTTENSYNEDKQTLLLPESHYFEDVLKNHQSLKLYQGEKYVCDEEVLSGYLFPTNKKCFAGYRSQELFPVQKPVTESAVIPEIFVLPNKTLLKYNSCDDTILIRSQIKLNKTKKLQHSQSFPEQFCSSDQIFSSTAESSMNQSNLVASTTSRMTCAGNNKTSTRKVNSSSFNFRSEISETYSHYYYSFPRFVSAFNQTIQSPLEKGFLKAKAKRKKRTMTKNRVWSERFGTEEGVEASTNYLSETELPEFQNNKNTQIKEEQRIQLCFCDDYHEHKLLTSSNIALHEITSNNLQYISFELTSNLAALLLHQQRIRNL